MNTSIKTTTCLNCGNVFEGNYCSGCSQSSATGRMSFSRLFAQDFLSNVFNLDRGFFRTCIDLIIRPGEAVTNYLNGQRKSYFHFAGLLFILLAIEALLLSLAINSEFTVITSQTLNEPKIGEYVNAKGMERMYDFYKFTLALITPLLALSSFFLFKKLDYHYAEHVVIAWFYLAVNILVSLAMRFVGILPLSQEFYGFAALALGLLSIAITLRFYWQLSLPAAYGTVSRLARVFLVSLINTAIYVIMTSSLTLTFSN